MKKWHNFKTTAYYSNNLMIFNFVVTEQRWLRCRSLITIEIQRYRAELYFCVKKWSFPVAKLFSVVHSLKTRLNPSFIRHPPRGTCKNLLYTFSSSYFSSACRFRTAHLIGFRFSMQCTVTGTRFLEQLACAGTL